MKRICIALMALVCIAGPALAQGLTQQVMYFDGKVNYVELPPGMVGALTEGTVEAWVKWEKFNKWARVFDFGQKSNAAVIQTEKTSSSLNFAIWDRNGKRHRIQAKKRIQKGVWHHVAAVFGRSGMAFYIDGRQIGTDGFEGGLDQVAGGRDYIGKSNWPKDKLFQGHMAEFRVWSRRLSQKEILARKGRLLTGQEPGLVAYWRLGEVDGNSAPDAGPSGQAATVAGEARLVSVPAISRFLVPGELEVAAEVHYTGAEEAFDKEDYETAAAQFREALAYVDPYKDAVERANQTQRLADEAAALKHYTTGQEHMGQGSYIDAYKAFDAALKRVSGYRDAPALQQQALEKGSYKVGLCVFTSKNLRVHLDPGEAQGEAEQGKLKRFMKAIDRVGKLPNEKDLKRVDAGLHTQVQEVFEETRPPYIQTVSRGEMQALLTDRGVNPEMAHPDQVLEACREAGISVIILAEVTRAHARSSKSEDEKKAFTVRKESYTDSEGKKKKREVPKKRYKYYEVSRSAKMLCRVQYQIVDTATGEVMDQGNFSKVDSDEVKYVNWNRYDGVSPSSLRVMKNGKIKRLPSGERAIFDARSNLKGEWTMMGEATGQIGGELCRQVLRVLGPYRPETAHASK